MKKVSLLILVAVIVLGVLASCGGGAKPTTVTIAFVDQNGEAVISELPIEIESESPTVIDAVNILRDKLASIEGAMTITIDSEGKSVVNVDDFKEDLTPDENKMISYWMFTVNGEEPTGQASEVSVAEGAKIVYKYIIEEVEY